MGTTAQKLEYLGTTKSQLKDMINYGLDDDNKITSSTTFRNYVSSIFNAFLEALRTPDTLFTNLTKKSGTGTNITLNDTANAPMRIELGASELSQDGTPTPDSPQTIHTISGSNTIKVEGKNLLEITDSNSLAHCSYVSGANTNQYKLLCTSSDMYVNNISASGVAYSKSVNGNLISCNYGETIYFDTNNTLFTKNYFNEFDENLVSLGYYNKYVANGSYTPTNANCKYVTFRFGYGSGATAGTTYTLAPIVCKTSDTTYTPYTLETADVNLGDIEYCKIGTYEDKFIRSNDGTWQLEKNINKIVLDGTELNWSKSGNTTFDRFLLGNNIHGIVSAGGYSNYFKVVNINIASNLHELSNNGNSQIVINFSNYGETTLDQFKTWLGNHNVIFEYVLDNPTYTPITGTLATQLENVYQKMLSQKGQTNISQINDDLSFNLSVQAIEEL